MSRYRFIEAEKANHAVRMLCRVLLVSRSAYYDWRRCQAKQSSSELTLRVHLRAIHRRSRGTYGSPRMTAALRAEGLVVSRKKVAQLMREERLTGSPKKRFRGLTTHSDHHHPVPANLLARDFNAVAPNRAWVGDITYLPTRDGWAYLAVLIDLFSRRVVGWAVAHHMRAELCLEALRQATAIRAPLPGLVHHTDRGTQYACDDYTRALSAAGIVQSMSRKGNCWDNAVAESFFGTLEQELVKGRSWLSLSAARRDLGDYIHNFYNRERLHSANSYRSPNDVEQCFYWASARDAA